MPGVMRIIMLQNDPIGLFLWFIGIITFPHDGIIKISFKIFFRSFIFATDGYQISTDGGWQIAGNVSYCSMVCHSILLLFKLPKLSGNETLIRQFHM